VGALASEREAIEARIDSLAAELMEARLVAATPAPPVAEPVTPRAAKTKSKADAATPTGGDTELERLRMAVERINLHLGEREHAISELMRSRSAEIKIEDLAARIAQLEKRGGSQQASKSADAAADVADANPDLRLLAQRVEEAEKAAKADREKVLTQLERMASSIDWRFRRLESRESDAA
jgi:hypothetical protein